MESGLIPLWVTSIGTAAGVIYAIVRNGSRGKKQDDQLKTELKMEINTIKSKLDDPENGLGSIKKSVDDQKLHCVAVSTDLAARVKTNTDEINLLRKSKRK